MKILPKKQPNIKRAIRICLDHIISHQLPDGSFYSTTSNCNTTIGGRSEYFQKTKHTNFHASLIATALSEFIKNNSEFSNVVKSIGNRVADFLLSCRSNNWTWNYWHTLSINNAAEAYPDDLDDTALALATLIIYRPDLINGENMATFTKGLKRQESEIGGPYRTWYIDDDTVDSWNDVDIGVNANLLYSLSLQNIKLKNVELYIESAIDESKIDSLYYDNPLVLIYFISRWYEGSYKNTMINLVRKYVSSENLLLKSLSITSLVRLGVPIDSLISEAESLAQSAVRGIRYESLYVEKIENGKKWYSGSSSVTSAVVAEALFYFEKYDGDEYLRGRYDYCSMIQEKRILEEVRRRLTLSPLFINLSEIEKNSLIHSAVNNESIEDTVMLPYRCLGDVDADEISSDILISMGLAQILGTIAYGLYDKIDDGDINASKDRLLNRANIAHAECLRILTRHANSCGTSEVLDFFTDMNIAIEWELKNTEISYVNDLMEIEKIPDYSVNKILENKSIGIAVAPIILTLLHNGDDRNKKVIKLMRSFFENYLAARQIHDDIHDWLSDIKRGRLNYASSLCLNVIKNNGEIDITKKYTLDEIISTLSLFMDNKGIDMLVERIIKYLDEADLVLEKLNSLYETEYTHLKNVIDALRLGSREVIRHKNLLSDFARHYYTQTKQEIVAVLND